MKKLLLVVAAAFTLTTGSGATIGSDLPTNSVYLDGWTTGENGGTGFAPWTLAPSNSGAKFITTTSLWTLTSASGSTGTATRSFLGGAVSLGQTFEIDYYSGILTSGASAGLRFLNSSGETLWSFNYQGEFATYTIGDGKSSGAKSATVTTLGVHIKFTLVSSTTYSAVVTSYAPGGMAVTRNGSLIDVSGSSEIVAFQLFFTGNTASNASNQQSFTELSIVPEPSTFALVALAGFALLRARTRSSR